MRIGPWRDLAHDVRAGPRQENDGKEASVRAATREPERDRERS